MRRELNLTALFALIAFSTACEESPSPTELADAGVVPEFGMLPAGSVPFQAEANRSSLEHISCDAGVCIIDASGTGAANIMGPITWTSHIVEDFTVTPCDTAPAVVTLTGETGSITLEDSDGTVCPISRIQPFGFISASWEITGGTGEFSGISGNGTSYGPTAGAGPVVHLRGVVSY